MLQAQSGSIKAPQTRAELQALIAQRDELQGQLRALEDRRFQLAEQVSRTTPSLAVEVERRVKTLDASIDRLGGRIAQANEYIAAGQARFSQNGQWQLLPEPVVAGTPPAPAAPAAPAPPEFTTVPPPEFPDSRILERALLLEGAGFLLLGALVWAWMSRRFARQLAARTGSDPAQMAQLQQSVDAIALEVERISENQRWVTKVINEKALGAGEAQPVNVGAKAEKVR